MKIKFFTIPINSAEDYEKEVNSFLSTHKIVEINKQLTQSEGQSYWCIYIGYIEHGPSGYNNKGSNPDFLHTLPEKERSLFSQFRTVRKEIAREDNISAYLVATNDELAEIARLEKLTVANIKKVKGFGEKKAEKYAKRIIEKMQRYETSKEPDISDNRSE